MPLRVLIVEDEPDGASGSRSELSTSQDLEIVGHAINGEDAARVASVLRPDAVLVPLASSGHFAGAAESALLISQERRRAEQFRLIAQIGRRITALLTVEELLSQAPSLIQDTFGFYHVHIGLADGDVLSFEARYGVWRDLGECQICVPDRPRIDPGGDGALGLMLRTHAPVVVADVNASPFYRVWHEGQKGSGVTAPIEAKGQFIGIIEVESERVDAFDDTDVVVLQSLADQLAVAIENAQLYEQAQKLAATEERQRLARELHDSVSQALYGIALGARTARTHLERDPAKVAEPLDYVLMLAKAAQSEMRALIFELRPESLEKEGLVAALGKQADALAARHRVRVVCHFPAEPDAPLQVKQALYRIAQEALHNISKHARAGQVEMRLNCDEAAIELQIIDDGIGFDPAGDYPGHLGLRSMRERTDQLGGNLAVNSANGGGTQLVATIPLGKVA